MLNQQGQDFHRVRPHDELVMIRSDVLCNTARVMKLAEVLLFKTDGEGLDRLAAGFAHQGDNC